MGQYVMPKEVIVLNALFGLLNVANSLYTSTSSMVVFLATLGVLNLLVASIGVFTITRAEKE